MFNGGRGKDRKNIVQFHEAGNVDYLNVGKAVPRFDGTEKVIGKTLYAGDIGLPGTLWGAILRSPIPHGELLSINTSKAKAIPGVRTVLTSNELPATLLGRRMKDMPILARGRVRYVGEPVAALAAETAFIAQEALNHIQLAYNQIPAVYDPAEAMTPGSPTVHEDPTSYRNAPSRPSNIANLQSFTAWERSDINSAFQAADSIFEHTFRTQLTHHGYLEPHACTIRVVGDGKVEIWASNKEPYILREELSDVLGISSDQIKIYILPVGGDFGGKQSLIDVPICYFLAQASGRPVRLLLDYADELTASAHRHPSFITLRTGVKKDGSFCAMHAKLVFAGGAYAAFKHSPDVSVMGARRAASYYRIPAIRIEAYCAYTNHVPCTQARAPGSPQVVFAVESQVDMIAKEMGFDPLEFRFRNLVAERDESPLGEKWNYVRAKEALEAAVQASTWNQPKPSPYYGRGVAMYERGAATGKSSILIVIDKDGTVKVTTGVPDCGPGIHTVIQQIVAEILNLSTEQVSVATRDTDTLPFDCGVGGSKATNTAGHAASSAAWHIRGQLLKIAANQLFCQVEDVILTDGGFQSPNGRSLSFGDVARLAYTEHGRPLSYTAVFEPSAGLPVTSFCAQIVEVQVDPETGFVDVKKLISAHDVGMMLNPLSHQGQIDGGVVQGIGYALMEETPLIDGRVATVSLADFKIPCVKDIPKLTTVIVSNPTGPVPYNGKAIGEIPNVPVAAALANAIADATGVRLHELPITSEKLYWILRQTVERASSMRLKDV
jgi:carbon-monoxide dehydrogenase large subunit